MACDHHCVQMMSRRVVADEREVEMDPAAAEDEEFPVRQLCEERWYLSFHDFLRLAVEEYETQRLRRWHRAWMFWDVSRAPCGLAPPLRCPSCVLALAL